MTAVAHETPIAAADLAPTVVGIDPSLTATGIASSRGWCEVVGYTDKKNPITKLPHGRRIAAMRQVLRYVLDNVGMPDLAVIETPALSRAGGGAHERGWLWWQVYGRLADLGVPVGLVSTNQLKQYATGKGNVDKPCVVDAVARRWTAWETRGNDNAADAVVLMAAGRDWLGHPIAAVPQTHRRAIQAATWPEEVAA